MLEVETIKINKLLMSVINLTESSNGKDYFCLKQIKTVYEYMVRMYSKIY